ncbi:protein phosphatase 2C domain-containing protein [Parafrigoribacterium mesophilum]
MVLGWAALTDTGLRRAHNEDSLLSRPPVFAVADGMGGHAAGDVASAAVVARLDEVLSGDFLEPGVIDTALRAATADIALAADEDQLGVGTTVTGIALTVQGNGVYWTVFNVGDSRVYLFEDGELSRLTVDHSVVQELVDSGAIRPEDAESHPRGNIITRAVGFNVEPVPDYWMLPVRENVRLLLCSDGLTKELKESAIRDHLAAGQDAARTADTLVAAALSAGGRDNVTVIVVDVLGTSGFFD